MGSRRKASLAFIAVVLFGVAIAGAVSVSQPHPYFTTPIPQTSPQGCPQAYPPQTSNRTSLPNGTEITQVAFPALVVSPGSTTILCVDYGNGTYSGPAYNSVSTWNGERPQGGQDVSVSASPADLFISDGQNVDIEYTLVAGPNSTGFYGLGLLQMCFPVPIAIGYEPSQVNSTDFPGLFGARFGCPAQVLGAQIIGYSGGSIAYLKATSSFNPTINITDVSVSSFPTSQEAENVTFRMNIQSFSRPLTAGLSLNESIVRVFGGNPDLTTLPVNDYCSWYPDNTNEVNDMKITAFQDLPAGFMQIDAPVLQLGAYSNSTYTFSVLISGPIAKYTAIDPTLYAGAPGSQSELYSMAAYFPVSISGQLQSVSGHCEGSSSG